MNFEQMGGSEMGQGPRPDTIPPVSGRTSRADQAAATRRLRDEVLRLVAEQPRTETQLVEITGATKGEVKSALRRLVNADLVFSRESGTAYRDVPLWHHWPTVIANLKARESAAPRRALADTDSRRTRQTGMRVA